MDKIKSFFENHYNIIIILVIIIGLKCCSIGSNVNLVHRDMVKLTKENMVKDSILNSRLVSIENKLDSTLISNSAVVSTVNSNKGKDVIVKVVRDR